MSKRLYIVAGELSGDTHAALLLDSLQESIPELELRGVGGPNLEELSKGTVRNWMDRAAVMGIWEVLKNYLWFRKRFFEMLEELKRFQPNVLLLVDYPGFNLRFAKAVRKACPRIRIVQYVCPQVWAWNKRRIPFIESVFDEVFCLFPFEQSLFSSNQLKVTFAGHPLMDEVKNSEISEKTDNQQLIGLFPGSREREVERLLPMMLQAAEILKVQNKDLRFEIPAATPKLEGLIQAHLQQRDLVDSVRVTTGGSHSLMERATCAVVASGTATLEAACFGLPYCLVYRVAPLTYWLAKLLVKIRWIGIVNILAGREVVKEFIQGAATPAAVSGELQRLLHSEEDRDSLRSELKEVVAALGGPGVHLRAAAAVGEWLREEG